MIVSMNSRWSAHRCLPGHVREAYPSFVKQKLRQLRRSWPDRLISLSFSSTSRVDAGGSRESRTTLVQRRSSCARLVRTPILRARSIEMRKLNDKVAWITGAGTGIGAAAARALVHDGMQVVLSGRRREPLDALAAELGRRGAVAAARRRRQRRGRRARRRDRRTLRAHRRARQQRGSERAQSQLAQRDARRLGSRDPRRPRRFVLLLEGRVADDGRATRRLDRQRVVMGRQSTPAS